MIIYISETDKGKSSVYGDRLVCETELITVMFFDKSFSPNSMNYRILTAYEEIGTVAEFKELKQENVILIKTICAPYVGQVKQIFAKNIQTFVAIVVQKLLNKLQFCQKINTLTSKNK